MKRFIFKLVIFILPFLVVLTVELFILPIDYFTFRVWEALSVRKFKKLLTGPFYPNLELTKVEEGDLAHHTKYSKKKVVKWITDQYGYRKINGEGPFRIVIVGDSNIAGSGLTQKEILSEVLESQLKVRVYPMAPAGIGSFLKERRFIEKPPDLVILASVEREITYFSPLKSKRRYQIEGNLLQSIKALRENRFFQSLFILLDRLYKMNMLHYYRANIKRWISAKSNIKPKYIVPLHGPIFFLEGPEANREVPREVLEKAVQLIKSYHDAVTTRGIRFLFLPIPEKENILHEILQTPKPTFLGNLIKELKRQGVEVIDTQKAFEEAFQKNQILPYQIDDTHWSAEGVKITAELIRETVGGEKYTSN